MRFNSTHTVAQAITVTVLLGAGSGALAQAGAFADFQRQAWQALGGDSSQRLEFTAQGWEACMGQPWRIDAGWARWELTDYKRVLDFSAGQSLQTAQRRAGMDPGKIGGCGAQPDAQPTNQQSSINPQSAWDAQLPLWLTPQGFLTLAASHDAAVTDTNEGATVSFTVSSGGMTFPFTGTFDDDKLLTHIETRLDDPVFGDMLVTADFGSYREFSGVQFPTSLVIGQGGFTTLNLGINAMTPNTTASAEPPPRQGGPGGGGGGGAPQPQGEAITEVAPGIFVSNGAYQSVIVEMQEAIVIIDGLQNDARAAQIIEQAKSVIPNKPIRYVISTHAHFDHANGLRAFMAEGATLITHTTNAEFFRQSLAMPRTLRGESQSGPVPFIHVLGVGDFFALSDPENRIELHRLQGNIHADDMLVAWLPGIKAVVEADVLQPWINPVFGGNGDKPHPFLMHLDQELQRLKLDYDKFIPIHRPPQPPFMTKADLLQAVKRTE